MPEIQAMPKEEKQATYLELQKVNFDEIKNAKSAMDNFSKFKLSTTSNTIYLILIPIFIIVALVIILVILSKRSWKTCLQPFRKTENQKIQEPAFSDLMEGGVM